MYQTVHVDISFSFSKLKRLTITFSTKSKENNYMRYGRGDEVKIMGHKIASILLYIYIIL